MEQGDKKIKIAEILADLARERGVSLREVSRSTKVPSSVLNDITAGRLPRADRLHPLAQYFGVSIFFLLYGKEENEDLILTEGKEQEVTINGLTEGVYEVTIRICKVRRKGNA